jgi:hypothetical protein
VSAVSVAEVLGNHKLSAAERAHFEAFSAAAEVLPLLTHNLKDFAGVPGLAVSDPLAGGDPA